MPTWLGKATLCSALTDQASDGTYPMIFDLVAVAAVWSGMVFLVMHDAKRDPEKTRHQVMEELYWSGTVVVGIMGVSAAIAAANFAAHAYSAATQQADTAAKSLDEARKQTGYAKSQADAATKSLPRSWLFVDLPNPDGTDWMTEMQKPENCGPYSRIAQPPFTCLRESGGQQPGSPRIQNFDEHLTSVELKISIRNYGSIPGTIESVRIILMIQHPNAMPVFLNADCTPSAGNQIIKEAGEDEHFSGLIIPPGGGSEYAAPKNLLFMYHTDDPELQNAFDVQTKALLISIHYRDPHGTGHKTTFFSALQFGGSPGENPACNAQE